MNRGQSTEAAIIVLQGNEADGISLLTPGIFCAKLRPGATEDQAKALLDHMKALIDVWEAKWRPGKPDDPGRGVVVSLRRAA